MKSKFLAILALVGFLFQSTAFASITVYDNGTRVGETSKVDFSTGFSVAESGTKLVVTATPSTMDVITSTTNGEMIDFQTDDEIKVLSDDSHTTFNIVGYEAKNAILKLCADQCDDTADLFKFTMDTSDLMTIVTGATTAATVSTAGLWTLTASTVTGAATHNGATTLGDAVTDVNTITGKIAGATPLTFDGSTADTVYTIFAMDDPTSSSKTITFPAVTGTVKLSSAAVALTPGTTVTLTVVKGTTLYTDTIVTDNQDQTINASGGGNAGDEIRIIFVTDAAGSNDEVITFGTNMRSAGTLTLANAASSRYVVSFVSDGTKWNEVSRTAIQAA